MRRFRFIGDAEAYHKWKTPPVFNEEYSCDQYNEMWGDGDFDDGFIEDLSDWEEVIEKETMITDGKVTFTPINKSNHKDTDLGYFAGLAMKAMLSNANVKNTVTAKEIAIASIESAEELIKQLNEKIK